VKSKRSAIRQMLW